MPCRILLSSSDSVDLDTQAPDLGARAVATRCAEKIWSGALAGKCKQWLGGNGDKVLAALLQCGSATVRAAATKELGSLMKEPIAQWSERVSGQGAANAASADGKKSPKSKPAAASTPAPAAAAAQHQPKQQAAKQAQPKAAAAPVAQAAGKQKAVQQAAGPKAKRAK